MEITAEECYERWPKLKEEVLDQSNRFPKEVLLDLCYELDQIKRTAFANWKSAEASYFEAIGNPMTSDLKFLSDYQERVRIVQETAATYTQFLVRYDSARILYDITSDRATDADHWTRIVSTSRREWEMADETERGWFYGNYELYCERKWNYYALFVAKRTVSLPSTEMQYNAIRMRVMKDLMTRAGSLKAPNYQLCLYMPN